MPSIHHKHSERDSHLICISIPPQLSQLDKHACGGQQGGYVNTELLESAYDVNSIYAWGS